MQLLSFKILALNGLLFAISLAGGSSLVSAAEVLITNDLGKQYDGTKLEIDHIIIDDIPKSKFRVVVYPGETKSLAAGDITRFTLSRVFPTHKVKYEVVCDSTDAKTVLTLEQIHENQMSEVCTLKKFGHWSRRTGLKWSDI